MASAYHLLSGFHNNGSNASWRQVWPIDYLERVIEPSFGKLSLINYVLMGEWQSGVCETLGLALWAIEANCIACVKGLPLGFCSLEKWFSLNLNQHINQLMDLDWDVVRITTSGGSKARRPRALARAPGQFFCNFLCKFL